MQCPSCNVTLMMSDRQGIEIDYCPKCRGVWLDRGELDKIIERSNPAARSPQPRSSAPEPYRQEHAGYRGKHKKRKESFLEDLFDF